MKATIIVKPKKGVSDPQGNAIKKVANNYFGVEFIEIKSGKYFEVEIENENAKGIVEQLASRILSNEIIEDYEIIYESRDS
ncbi:MAG TPA: phosphoribosylformylglycinamidine synthase, purS protein [Desulfurella acetivorans]|uniref:Phosphoribosylformylglycinamidine synthase subunit PurS n=1 Tax=Desulfurella acetivorans TaxID=33002 RepID=A0A7C6E8D3_DESAE|nr:phosphoribosylformylglycinamidine synthase, purS protein [Desulfurella acetivorans]